MRKRKPKLIIQACILDFEGTPYEQIAEQLKINKGTITNWRKTDIWKQTEAKLVDAYIEKSVNTQEIKIMRDTHV